MALTPLEQKWYRAKLLSDPTKEIKFRPFTVKDQKYIMLNESARKKSGQKEWNWNDWKILLDLVQNCVDNKDIDVYEMYEADFMKLFFDIRTIADGEIYKFTLGCKNKVKKDDDSKDKKECGTDNECSININEDLRCSSNEFTKEIELKEHNRTVYLKQPSIRLLAKIQTAKYESDELMGLDMIAYCIDKVTNGDTIEKDFTHDEAVAFIDSIAGQKSLEEFSQFFENSPQIVCDKEFVCSKCGKKKKLTPSEVRSFLM